MIVGYEYFVFRYVPNIVSGEFRDFGVCLRTLEQLGTSDTVALPGEHVGVGFASDLAEMSAGLAPDGGGAEVLQAFVKEALSKSQQAKASGKQQVFAEWLTWVAESNSGITVEGPILLSSPSFPQPMDALQYAIESVFGRSGI